MIEQLKFYIDEPEQNSTPPYFILRYNSWDDYGRQTTFNLTYIDSKRQYHSIGKVKIMHEEEPTTIKFIPKSFSELSDKFCSLGQSIGYYEELKYHLPNNYQEVLEALNDAAFLNGVQDRFENNYNFTRSLLRSSEAEKALYEAKKRLLGHSIDSNFTFTYNCQVKNANGKHTVNFNFGDKDDLPNRIIAFIGKNGTGKTQVLSHLALDLSGQSKKILKEDVFTPKRPLFSKIITVSYSIFDNFTRPKSNKQFSYVYCGLKDLNGRLLTSNKLINNYQISVEKIKEDYNKGRYWYDILKTILGEETTGYFYEEIFENENYQIVDNKTEKILSSGQSFLMYVITEVIANIKPDSLILFDEPEMHLHPNAIANLIRMLDKLLNRFDSYAIIATHSPIIIQEIPSNYVTVFDREGNTPMTYKLGFECFGENIDFLTQEVFKTKDVNGNYKEVLLKLSKKFSYDEVLNLFDNKLILNAKSYLLGLYEASKLN